MKMSPSLTHVTRPTRPNLSGVFISVLVYVSYIVKTQGLPLTGTRTDAASTPKKTEFGPHKVTPSFQVPVPNYFKQYAYRISSQPERSKMVNEYPNVYGNYLKLIDPPQEVYSPNNVHNNLEGAKTRNEYNDASFNYGYQQPQVLGANDFRSEEVEQLSGYQIPGEINPSYQNSITSPKRRRDIRTDQYRYDQIFANDFDDAYSGTEDRIYYYYYDPAVNMRYGGLGSRQFRYDNNDVTNDNAVSQNVFNVREKTRSKSKFGKIRAPGERTRDIFSDRKLPGDRSNSGIAEDVGRLPVQNQGQHQNILSPVLKSEYIEERGNDRDAFEKVTTPATVTDKTSAQTTTNSKTSVNTMVASNIPAETTATSNIPAETTATSKTSVETTTAARTSAETTTMSRPSTENKVKSRTSTEPTAASTKTSAETTEATRTSVRTTITSKTSTENREKSRTSTEPTVASSRTYVETTATKITTAEPIAKNKTFTLNMDSVATSKNSTTPMTRSNTTETAKEVETPAIYTPTNETYAETTAINNTLPKAVPASGNSLETTANRENSEMINPASKATSTKAPKSSIISKESTSKLPTSTTSDDELYMDVKNQVGDYLGWKPDISPYRNSVLDVGLNKTSHAHGKSGQHKDSENRTIFVSNNTTSVGESLTEKENKSLSDVEKEKRLSEPESENKKPKISDKNDNKIIQTTKRTSENLTSELKTGQKFENTNVIKTDKENGLNTEIKKKGVQSKVDIDSNDFIDSNELNVPQVMKNESQTTSNIISTHKTHSTSETRVTLQNQTSTEGISSTENDQSISSLENVTTSKISDRSPSKDTIQTVQHSEDDEDIKKSENTQVENTEIESKTIVEDNNHLETIASNSSTIIESINDTSTEETDALKGENLASDVHTPPTEIKILMKKDEQKKRTNEINSLASVRASEIPTIQFNDTRDDRNGSISSNNNIPKDVDIPKDIETVKVENTPQTEINEFDINVKDTMNATGSKRTQNENNTTDLNISQNDDSIPNQESKTLDTVKPSVNISHTLETHDVSKTTITKNVSVAEIRDAHTTTVSEDKMIVPTEQIVDTSLLQTPQKVGKENTSNVPHNEDDTISESDNDLNVTLDKQPSTIAALNNVNSTPLSSEGKAENTTTMLLTNKETKKTSGESLEVTSSNNAMKSKTPTILSETSPTILSTQESINIEFNNIQIQTDILQENILEPKNQHFESTISIHEEVTVDENKTTKSLNEVFTTLDSSGKISENISSNITSQNVSYQQRGSAEIETIPTRTAHVKSSPKSSDVPSVNHTKSSDVPSVNHTKSSDALTVNHTKSSDAPTVDHTKSSDVPTVNHTKSSDAPTVDHTKSSDVPTVNHTKSSDAPTVDHTKSSDAPTVNHTKSSDAPTVDHTKNSDAPTVNHTKSSNVPTVNHSIDSRPSSEDKTKKSKSVSAQNDTSTLHQPNSPKLHNRNVSHSQKNTSPAKTNTKDSGIQAENKPVHQQRHIPRQPAHRLTLADFPSLLLRRQEISRNKIVMSSDIGGDKMAISSNPHKADDDGVRGIKIPRTSAYMIQDFALRKPEDWQLKSPEDPKGQDTSDEISQDGCNNTTCGETSSDRQGYSLPHRTTTTRAKAAVSAVLTTHFGPTKQEIIPFNLVLLDLADNYDNTTGMFIATIPGTYVVSVYLMSHPGAKVNARVYVNDRPVAALWADDSKHAGFYPSSSIQTVAQLGFGDQVYVMLVDGGYGDSWVHANYNVFTVFLLYEETF